MAGFMDDWGGAVSGTDGLFDDYGQMRSWGSAPMSLGSVPTAGLGTTIAPIKTGGLFGGGGFSMDKAQLALSGLATIGGVLGSIKQAKLAKQQFKYTKSVTDTNLANSMRAYNTSLEDRARNRQIVEGTTPEQTRAYIDANAMRRYG